MISRNTRFTFAALAIMLSASVAWADPFEDGWCAGYKAAQDNLAQNRDHWRSLLREPKETNKETLARMFAHPETDPTVIDSVDLYVILGSVEGSFVTLKDGRAFQCK